MTATDFPALITLLAEGGVEFIVIGGVAATIHGSAHITVRACRSDSMPPPFIAV